MVILALALLARGEEVHTYCEFVEAQHVHDTDLGNDRPKQVWPLVAAGCHQQTTIGASLHHRQHPDVTSLTIRKQRPLGVLSIQLIAELDPGFSTA